MAKEVTKDDLNKILGVVMDNPKANYPVEQLAGDKLVALDYC